MEAIRNYLSVGTALLSTVVGVSTVSAQNFERYKPKDLQSLPDVVQLPARTDLPTGGSDAVLVESLNAIIVLDHASKVQPHNAFAEEQGVRIEVDAADSLALGTGISRILNGHLNQPVTLRRLNELSREIILHYQKCGQPVVDVQIPEQKITSGTLQIVIVESRIDTICVTDVRYGNAQRMRSQIEYSQPGQRIYESAIAEDLYWLNRYQFRKASIAIEPGAREGTSDLKFKISEVTPIRAYTGYEDTGVRALGLERLFAGVIIGNPFGRDGTLGYQYTADGHFSYLQAHALSYGVDFNRNWAMTTYGSWAAVSPNLPAPMNQDGESWQTGIQVSRYLERTMMSERALSMGFDFKSTNNSLEFGGTNVQQGFAELAQLNFGYDRMRRWDNGNYWLASHDVNIGPGSGFTSNSNAAAFNTIRANTDPAYVYYVGKAQLRAETPRGLEFQTRFTGQMSSDRLLFSEMIGLGGFDSIRGYDQRTLNGDGGWVLNLELGPKAWVRESCNGTRSLRSYVFADLGQSIIRDPVPGEIDDQFISSAGVGMRYNISNRLNVRCDYGHGFNAIPGVTSRDRIHLGLVALFGPVPK